MISTITWYVRDIGESVRLLFGVVRAGWNLFDDFRYHAINSLRATGSSVEGGGPSQPNSVAALGGVFTVVAVWDPLAGNKNDDLMPQHGACSKCNANEPLLYAQTAGSKSNTAKFNEDDLRDDRDDHDIPKNWIAENVMKHIALIIELAHVNLIEFGHHDKGVEYHGVVHGGQLFVRAVASLIEKFAGMAV